jgi:hypothetical protein
MDTSLEASKSVTPPQERHGRRTVKGGLSVMGDAQAMSLDEERCNDGSHHVIDGVAVNNIDGVKMSDLPAGQG